MTATTATQTVDRSTTRPRSIRLLPIAGTTYVLAWLVGLFIAPSAPANDASAQDIHRYFAAHGGPATLQALLVHGIAGLALVALTTGFARALTGTRFARLISVTGFAAAAVSLAQFGFAVTAGHDVAHTSAGNTASWFHAINYADTAKLVLLAAFAVTVTTAARHGMPRWLRITGRTLAPLLVLGGLDFVAANPVFAGALDLSLIALLVWAGGTARQLSRRSA